MYLVASSHPRNYRLAYYALKELLLSIYDDASAFGDIRQYLEACERTTAT